MRPAKRMYSWGCVGFQSSVFATIALATSVTFAQGPPPGGPGSGGSATASTDYSGEVTSVELTKNVAQSGVAYLQGNASFKASVDKSALNASYTFMSRVNIKEIGLDASNSLWEDERDKTINRGKTFTWSMGNGDPGTARGTGTSFALYAFIYLKGSGTNTTLLDDDSDTLVW